MRYAWYMTKTPEPIMYYIHDTNSRDMPEVATYTADTVAMADGSACILFQLAGELVAIHHLAPGHTVTPEAQELPEEDAAEAKPAYTVGERVETLFRGRFAEGVIVATPAVTGTDHYRLMIGGERINRPEVAIRKVDKRVDLA